MGQRRILVVEDDEPIRRGVVDALEGEGYDVAEAGAAPDGLQLALSAPLDLLLLDLVLPVGDGLELLEAVRSARPALPVIILTARGDESDRVRGLRLGADDYVVKPFSVRELLARVEAVLRRGPSHADGSRLRFPGGWADLDARTLHFRSAPPGGPKRDVSRLETSCPLSEREAALLRYLAANAGRCVTRDEILAQVWQLPPVGVETRTIDMHVCRLREKLRDDAERPRILRTLRGQGYMFLGPEGTA